MPENILKFTDDDFEQEVLQADKVTMVDFWAEWCQPCHMLAPTVEDLANLYVDQLKVGKLNVDENPKTATKYGIRGIPTLLLFKNGEMLQQLVGVRPKVEIQKLIDSLL